MDVWYVDHWSLLLDLSILAKAFVLLFRRSGVYGTVVSDSPNPKTQVEQA